MQRLVVVGVAGQVMLGCGDQDGNEPAVTTIDSLSTRSSQGRQEGYSCIDDTTGLTKAEAMTRTTFQYVDLSTVTGRNCANCALYITPESESSCGSCLTIKGPIHPDGYCTIWAAQTG